MIETIGVYIRGRAGGGGGGCSPLEIVKCQKKNQVYNIWAKPCTWFSGKGWRKHLGKIEISPGPTPPPPPPHD